MVAVLLLAGWALPLLLLLAEAELVVQGWSKVGVGEVAGGAGVAGDGDTVLERCKPL